MSKLEKAINETPNAAIKSIVKELMSIVRERDLTMRQRKELLKKRLVQSSAYCRLD